MITIIIIRERVLTPHNSRYAGGTAVTGGGIKTFPTTNDNTIHTNNCTIIIITNFNINTNNTIHTNNYIIIIIIIINVNNSTNDNANGNDDNNDRSSSSSSSTTTTNNNNNDSNRIVVTSCARRTKSRLFVSTPHHGELACTYTIILCHIVFHNMLV